MLNFSLLGCLELMLLLNRVKVGGSADPNFFLHSSSSWVKLRLPSENHPPGLPGSASRVCCGVGGWGGVGNKVIMRSIQLELS